MRDAERRKNFGIKVERVLHTVVPAIQDLREGAQRRIYENAIVRDDFLRTLVLELLHCQARYQWNDIEIWQKRADRVWHEIAGWRHPAFSVRYDPWPMERGEPTQEGDSDEFSAPEIEDWEGADQEWRDPFGLRGGY